MLPWPKVSFAERSSGGNARGYIREERKEEEESEPKKGNSGDKIEMICVIQVQPSPLLPASGYLLEICTIKWEVACFDLIYYIQIVGH